jgi:hypothetical protein
LSAQRETRCARPLIARSRTNIDVEGSRLSLRAAHPHELQRNSLEQLPSLIQTWNADAKSAVQRGAPAGPSGYEIAARSNRIRGLVIHPES